MKSSKVQPRMRAPSVKRLNPQQQAFVEYLVADPQMNGIEAARRAGYKSPQQSAYQLMNNPVVIGNLGKAREEMRAKIQLEAHHVVRELMRIGFADPRQIFTPDGVILPIHQWPDDIARAVSGFDVETTTMGEGKDGKQIVTTTVKPRFWSKPAALKELGTMLGILDKDGKATNVGGTSDVGTAVSLLLAEALTRKNVVDLKFIESKVNEVK